MPEDCEFKKECENVAGIECLTKKVKRCLNRKFAILVHDRAIQKASERITEMGYPAPAYQLNALKMEVE